MANDLSKKIASSLEKLSQVQRTLQWEMAGKENLSPIQIQFLIYLNKHGEQLRTVTALAEDFDLTKATVSDAVATLVSKGLLKKVQQPADKRSQMLLLTHEGEKTVQRIEDWRVKLLSSMKSFSEQDQLMLFDLLNRLIVKLNKDKVISVVRMCTTCGNFMVIDSAKKRYKCGLTGQEFSTDGIDLGCNYYTSAD